MAHVASEFDAVFSESDLIFVEDYRFTNDETYPWSYADDAITSQSYKRIGSGVPRTSDLTLSITLKRAMVLEYTAKESGSVSELLLSVDGGESEILVSGNTSTVVNTQLGAGAHTLVWTHRVRATANRRATLSGFAIQESSNIVTVTVEKAGTAEDTILDFTTQATVAHAASTTANPGQGVALRAIDGTYSVFTGWYLGGELLSTDKEWTYTVPETDVTITARFADREMDGVPQGWKVGVDTSGPWVAPGDGVLYSETPTSYGPYVLYLKFTAAETSQLSFGYLMTAEPIKTKLTVTLNNGTEDVINKAYADWTDEAVSGTAKLYLPAGAYTMRVMYSLGNTQLPKTNCYAAIRDLRLDSLAPFLHVREHRVLNGATVTVRRQTAAELVRMADGKTLEERLDALSARVAKLQNGG